ncbi:hypothetical protein RFI_29295 [Reticulomyxa filosa]|uniref:Uncharacterized protein n=1 Tax=Reticulomyxa filosa TaxID=46433 RepID=X6M3Q1_RETFI|nr:hypothetical protein RFI_29295 [Reticulomyxa filosa]|eukprot:ETO08097.1 hypothetical protein RFI_29295 [Reticulomyxa filosa]
MDDGTQRVLITTDNCVSTYPVSLFNGKSYAGTGFFQLYCVYAYSGSGAQTISKPETWVSGVNLGNMNGIDTITVSSNSSGDTGYQLIIRGYIDSGSETYDVLNLNGSDSKTPVTSSSQFVSVTEFDSFGSKNFSGNIYVYRLDTTAYALSTIPSGVLQKGYVCWFYIPIGYNVYIHGLQISSYGTTLNHKITLKKYFVGATPSNGSTYGGTIQEWPITSNYYYDYGGKIAIRGNDNADQIAWFEVNFSNTDTNARVFVRCEFEFEMKTNRLTTDADESLKMKLASYAASKGINSEIKISFPRYALADSFRLEVCKVAARFNQHFDDQ